MYSGSGWRMRVQYWLSIPRSFEVKILVQTSDDAFSLFVVLLILDPYFITFSTEQEILSLFF